MVGVGCQKNGCIEKASGCVMFMGDGETTRGCASESALCAFSDWKQTVDRLKSWTWSQLKHQYGTYKEKDSHALQMMGLLENLL